MKKFIIAAILVSCSCCASFSAFEGGVFTTSGFQPTNNEQKFYVPVKDVLQPDININKEDVNKITDNIIDDDEENEISEINDFVDYYISNLSKQDSDAFSSMKNILKRYNNTDVSNLLSKYSADENVMDVILGNFEEMKKDNVLTEKTLSHVLTTTNWDEFDGKNYALALAKRMEKSNQYSNEEINKWVGQIIDWSQINSEPQPETIKIVNKGYLKYFDYLNNNAQISDSKDFLSNYLKTIDLMKSYNADENAIISVIKNSDWSKAADTFAIISYLYSTGFSSNKKIEQIFNNSNVKKIYSIYSNLKNKGNTINNQIEFVKNIKTFLKDNKTTTTNSVISKVTEAAPAYIPLLLWGNTDNY